MEKIVEIPEIQTNQDTQTFERVGAAPVCRVCFAETLDVVEFVPPLRAESGPPMRRPPRSMRFLRCRSWRGQSRSHSLQTIEKIVEIPEIQTVPRVWGLVEFAKWQL